MRIVISSLGILRRIGQTWGPYLMLEILLPGGTLLALLLFLYRRRKLNARRDAPPTAVALPRALVRDVERGNFVLQPRYPLVLVTVAVAGMLAAYAQSAAARASVSGTKISSTGTVSGVSVTGVQGSSGGGSGGIGFGTFRLFGGGGTSTSSMSADAPAGAVSISGATVSGSNLPTNGTIANSTVRGATLSAGNEYHLSARFFEHEQSNDI
jgi:hypothetical protein